MFLRLLIIITIVLVGAAVLDQLNRAGDDDKDSLLNGLGVVHSWFSEDDKAAGTAPVQTTTVYKWQAADGTWQFSNEPPPADVASSVTVYRSDTNVTPSVKPPADASSANDTPGPADTFLPITQPDKVKQLIEDARSVQELSAQREQTRQQ